MQLEEKHTKFLDAVLGASGQKKKAKEDEEKKAKVLDETLNSLTDADKEEMRKAMNFFAVDAKGNKTKAIDERGQEYALDTEAANRKGLVVDARTLKAVREQFDKIIQMVEKLRAANFDAAEIADEIFTPLVREGILPENLVTDQYSEVQKLLGASYQSYKETLEEARQDEEKAKAKTQSDYHGAGSKLDMVKGLGGKAGELQERILETITPKAIGGKEARERTRELAMNTYSAVSSAYSSVGDVKGMISGQAAKDALDTLSGVKAPPTPPSTLFSEWGEKAAEVFDKNPALKSKFAEQLAKAIKEASTRLDELSDKLGELQEEKWFEILESTLSALQEGGEGGVGSVVSSIELKSLKDELASAKSVELIRKAASEVVGKIDKAIAEAVKKVDSSGGAAMAGAYAGSVAHDKILGIAITATPEGKDIVKELAGGFGAAFQMFGDDDKAFEKAGKSMGDAFASEINAPVLSKAIKEDPKSAFDPVIEAASKAVEKHAGDLKDKLSDPKARRAMTKGVAKKLEKGLEAKLKGSEEEMAEYERQLVLMDEGDTDAADQVSIEKLIAQLKADKATLELAVSLASGLAGLGSSPTEIGSKATEAVTEKLAGQVAGPLAAAKMIVQLSVNIINAADRWKLWYKFHANLELSKKAVSTLTSTIQGFYDNKKEQIAFHTIEDALLAVQIAGSVVGSIPEPISMAVGKTLSSVAEAASAVNTVAGKVYNEVMLRKAWTTTKAAMDNPKDRSLGLAALRLNPTLSMHAIAWAALERRDPIARVFLDTCGLNEQTLADGGTTEKKVRDYLENYLDEDRKLKDTEKLKTNWQPKNITLSARDWAIVQVRADKATPKLRKEDTSKIREAINKVEANGSLVTLDGKTELDKMGPEIFIEWTKDVDNALTLMKAYQPRAEDGTPHEDMSVVVAQFVRLAQDHKNALIRARNENLRIDLTKANIRSQATGARVTESAGVLQGK